MKKLLFLSFWISVIVATSSSCGSNAAEVVPPPEARFTIQNNNCVAPCVVRFVNQSSGAVEQRWDFGNGDTSTDADVEILYDQEGTYTVTLTVTNRGGSRSNSKEVIIQ